MLVDSNNSNTIYINSIAFHNTQNSNVECKNFTVYYKAPGPPCSEVKSMYYDIRPKRKSLTIGELENSGFRRMQLNTIDQQCSTPSVVGMTPRRAGEETHLRKYSRPTLRFSKNFGRNLKSTLFGGRAGRALLACGNEETSLCLSSSNSEYLNRTTMGPPYQPTSQLETTTIPDQDLDSDQAQIQIRIDHTSHAESTSLKDELTSKVCTVQFHTT
jgi:hypothetical protein